MDAGDLEAIAQSAYDEAGLETEGPVHVARALLGPRSVEIVPPGILRSSWAALTRVGAEWRIFVRRGDPRRMRFAVGHELGHWLLRRAGLGQTEDEEREADYLGGALVAPRRPFLAAVRAVGRDLPELAEAFDTTESVVALRLGETSSTPIALVRPGLVRVRSPEEWVWPDEATIRRWAARPPAGLAKTRLRDDPRRVVLAGDGVG